MALLASRGFDTPSLSAQGRQRRQSFFNIRRDIPHGIDANGKVLVRSKLRRAEVLEFFANVGSCLVGMEACAMAHYWARDCQVGPRKGPTLWRSARS